MTKSKFKAGQLIDIDVCMIFRNTSIVLVEPLAERVAAVLFPLLILRSFRAKTCVCVCVCVCRISLISSRSKVRRLN